MDVTYKAATITSTGTDEDFPGTFQVILSAPTKDRDGETLLPEEWKTPLPEHITFDIDHGMSVATTVGSGVPSIDEKGQLVVDGTFSSLKPAQDTRTLVKEGHIRTTSVAFMSVPNETKGAPRGAKLRELLNGAFVAIPSNREALVTSAKGLKAGARNSASDAEKIQAIHDLAIDLGATAAAKTTTTDDLDKSARHAVTKAVAGSLEAVQDRARDALNDAYGADAWVWLQATLPDLLVFQISANDGSEEDTYQQSYTDDGSVITLTGERSPVDLVQVIKPDPDADAEPAAPEDAAAAAKAAAAAETKAADEADAITDEDIRLKALVMRLQIIP